MLEVLEHDLASVGKDRDWGKVYEERIWIVH